MAKSELSVIINNVDSSLNNNNIPSSGIIYWLTFSVLVLSLLSGAIVTLKYGNQIRHFITKKCSKPKNKPTQDSQTLNSTPPPHSICACKHRKQPHIIATRQSLRSIFPHVNTTHLYAGLIIVCLLRKCRTELIIPKVENILITSNL
jgi:hypothetical protein